MSKEEKLTIERLTMQECSTVIGGTIHPKNVALEHKREEMSSKLPHIPHKPGGPGV